MDTKIIGIAGCMVPLLAVCRDEDEELYTLDIMCLALLEDLEGYSYITYMYLNDGGDLEDVYDTEEVITVVKKDKFDLKLFAVEEYLYED